MIERKYDVDGKEVIVKIEILGAVPPQVVFEIVADKDTLSKYIDGNTLSFAIDIDDIFDAIRETLAPKKVLRD
ncbi:hypothetical protein [Deltalipothrixvirus pozzuoliense]|uniref:Uncharacterized protein ORF72 n=1 Tax=Acidianus filamentous virus 2 (isolate Italy/Pozzuoli) TaxID=654910 RepID=Y072_AFV2P|nr:hypothetical protein AFV2_gp16 [Acidianus filamentous virus 2]Q573F3.1 RecName: Full=Uncharacterized protein ORF72 [Acidianus filamentous virus 2 (isolate Pozzuoli)]CAH69403.1 hypothetical protein [Acidianus filamentous virus 2]